MNHKLVLKIFILYYLNLIIANNCTNSCDSIATGNSLTFCGTDYNTYTTKYSAIAPTCCYTNCGIMSLYEGICGCPNECFNSYNRGKCMENNGINMCICKSGWSGKDCSIPNEFNTCNNNGEILKNEDFFFYCKCNEGYTGIDCSSETIEITNTPWGNVFDTKVYTKYDTYKDLHPIFNISVLATIRVEMTEEEYNYLLEPKNLYNESYVNAKIHFDNGNIKETFDEVGIKIKGATSRLNLKKGWNIKFNEFVSGQKLLDLKKLGLKPGSVNDDTFLKTMLYSDFMRAVGQPVQRSSYSLLYINDMYIGLYYMQEDFSTQFIKSRIQDDEGTGNMYKMFYDVHLAYLGPNASTYQEITHTNCIGVPMIFYEQCDGNGYWQDLIDWLYYFNTTSLTQFDETVEAYLDVSSILKQMIVESFLMAEDNFEDGQNFYTYHHDSSINKKKWSIIEFDFDECFKKDNSVNNSIWDFFANHLDEGYYSAANPVITNLLLSSKYKSQFISYYKKFLSTLFGLNSSEIPSKRFNIMKKFITPWLEQDKSWLMSFDMTMDQFNYDASDTEARLIARYENVLSQLEIE
jgi:hypothetical protein